MFYRYTVEAFVVIRATEDGPTTTTIMTSEHNNSRAAFKKMVQNYEDMTGLCRDHHIIAYSLTHHTTIRRVTQEDG